MQRKLDGKVALVTGAAQGQGRAYAARLAQEGADLVLLDRCEQDPVVSYDMGTEKGLAQTAELVRDAGRRAIARQADVRDRDALAAAAADELGQLDVVVATPECARRSHGRGDV